MLLMIDNYDSFTYNLVQYLGELGQEVRVVRNDALDLAQIAALAPERIMISPGPGTPDDAGVSLQVLRTLGQRIPVFGVCLGHQALGQAFGGRVVRAREIMMRSGASAAICARSSASLRTTRTSCPSSPRYCTRL